MNSDIYPIVSVIIPTFNEERRLPLCLDSLRKQDYPFCQLDIVVVDDGSTDATRTIATACGATVVMSGKRHIERSKSIGLAAATGEYVLFLDADVTLIESDWIRLAVTCAQRFPNAVGVQGAFWQYEKKHAAPNRYSELLGVNDPLAYFLGKRGVFHPWDKTWTGKGYCLFDDPDATVVRFTLDQLPTLGSQGYLTRRLALIEHTEWQPYFFHLETVQALVARGFNEVIFLKRTVRHDYVRDWFQFYRKLYRNGILFLEFRPHRHYSYGLGSLHFFCAVVAMVTFIIPLYQAARGYVHQRDRVWLWHPVVCLVVPILYGMVVIRWYTRNIWKTAVHA